MKERRAELSHLAHAVVRIDKFRPETCCVVGNYYSLKAQHERAVLYFRRALRLNASFLYGEPLSGLSQLSSPIPWSPRSVGAHRSRVRGDEEHRGSHRGLSSREPLPHLLPLPPSHPRLQAVDLSGADFRAWYGLGQTYEMLHLYQVSAIPSNQ